MKNLVITTDFTENSEKAYKIGVEIAKANNSTITLYHSSHPLFLGGLAYTGFNTTDVLIDGHNADLHNSKVKMERLSKSPIFKGVELKTTVEDPHAESEIQHTIDFINSHAYDLVIMGISESHKDSVEFVDEMVNKCNTPTLIIHKEGVDYNHRNYLVTTDFDNVSAKYFKSIQKLSTPLTKLSILFVNTPDNFMSEEEYTFEYNKLVNKYHLKNTVLLHTDAKTVEEGILKHTSSGEFDMVCVATHGKSKFEKFFLGSLSEEVANKSTIPTLSVNLKHHIEDSTQSVNMGNFKTTYVTGVNQKAFL